MVHQEIKNADQKAWFSRRSADFRRIKAGQGEKPAKQFRFAGDIGKRIDGHYFRVGSCDRIKVWHIVCNSLSLLTKVKGR